jgi:hypothetical protein
VAKFGLLSNVYLLTLYLAYGLFCDVVSILDDVALNGSWKGYGSNRPLPNYKY